MGTSPREEERCYGDKSKGRESPRNFPSSREDDDDDIGVLGRAD